VYSYFCGVKPQFFKRALQLGAEYQTPVHSGKQGSSFFGYGLTAYCSCSGHGRGSNRKASIDTIRKAISWNCPQICDGQRKGRGWENQLSGIFGCQVRGCRPSHFGCFNRPSTFPLRLTGSGILVPSKHQAAPISIPPQTVARLPGCVHKGSPSPSFGVRIATFILISFSL
jgi:hypothetical protein